MIVTYYGGEMVKMQLGDLVVACNPISKDSKLKAARFGADLALVSLNHPDTNGVEQLGFGEKVPFVISGPGEYEIKDVFLKGFKTLSQYGGKDKINTVYTFSMDGMSICFLGALDSADSLGADAKESMEDIDLLFVPIGGEGVLDPAAAYKLAVQLEPKVIIPIHYGDVGVANALKTFLKEGGNEKAETVDKLTVKKKDLDGKTAQVIVLSPSNA
jgi:L-ascorbate metabolism protein UlaG (beta-lactamase superfamily)